MKGSEQEQGCLILQWRIHLAVRKLKLSFFLVSLIIFISILSFLLFKNFFLSFLTLFILFCALADYFLPIHYKITTKGAGCRNFLNSSFIEWSQVKNCYLDKYGVKLSPLKNPSRLEAFRGVFLRFDDENQEAVVEAVKRCWRNLDKVED